MYLQRRKLESDSTVALSHGNNGRTQYLQLEVNISKILCA